MSAGAANGGGRERLDAARRTRGSAELVGGLRDLAARRSGTRAPARPTRGPAEGRRAAGEGANVPGEEHCELCGAALAPDHRHLLHLTDRHLICACETCWSVRSGEASYRPAGVRVVWPQDFELPDEAWAAFGVPIGLAFFMRTGDPSRVVAFYPSPAGATESEIDPDAWERLEQLNPVLRDLEPDGEALIVDRFGEPHRFVIAPIDECYRLVGMIRVSWEGISGGSGPAEAIAAFFEELRRRSAGMARSDA